MVFVWSNLCEGEPHYTLSQVALNDVIMVFAFAPLVGLLLGVASITRALGYPADLGGAVYRGAGHRRAALAARAARPRAGGVAADPACAAAGVAGRAAD